MPPAGKDILMKITPAILIDLILLAVLVITMVRYAKKGFVSGLIGLVGSLVSLALAWIVSGSVSPVVFENLFKSGLTERMAEALQKQGANGVATVLDGLSGIVPQRFLDDIAGKAADIFNSGAPDIAQRVVEELIAPLVVPLIISTYSIQSSIPQHSATQYPPRNLCPWAKPRRAHFSKILTF